MESRKIAHICSLFRAEYRDYTGVLVGACFNVSGLALDAKKVIWMTNLQK